MLVFDRRVKRDRNYSLIIDILEVKFRFYFLKVSMFRREWVMGDGILFFFRLRVFFCFSWRGYFIILNGMSVFEYMYFLYNMILEWKLMIFIWYSLGEIVFFKGV